MKKKKFLYKIEKSVGFMKIRNQISSINMMLIFLVFAAVFSVYLNHTGWLLSYGIIVAGVSMIALALFLSYRIKLQFKLNNMKVDYRKYLVEPLAQEYFESGSFTEKGNLTEMEIISTHMFSDGKDFTYTSCNELKGIHKGVKFINSDIFENCKSNKIRVYGRLYDFDIKTGNINPVIFTTSTAPIIDFQDVNIHLIKTSNDEINRMFRIYAFDENEADSLLTDSTIHKLKQLVALQLGKIIKICFANDKVYVYYTTDKYTYEEVLTKKNKISEEIDIVCEKFNDVGKLIDIL